MADPRTSRQSVEGRRADCPRCRRTRWILTFIILATMSAILFLNLLGSA